MAKPTGFMEYPRELPADRAPEDASKIGRNFTWNFLTRNWQPRPHAVWTAASRFVIPVNFS